LEYEYILQGQLVTALCCLHNFIRKEGNGNDEFDLYSDDDILLAYQERDETGDPPVHKDVTEKEKRQAKGFRDTIANDMWIQYTKTINTESSGATL
jgi:hypothetical protein